ncbi:MULTISPECIES: ABC transporter permease [Amycolatopsis]|uniref:Transport permease protein n=2 Tax=Amycolatopsis TaxID=1813 RepID=A0ABV5TUP0_9PSEU|nr:ABC transporter permease [Amycolatopsis bullii]GHG20877.1 transport permease protein [Amycolatopsis bullii]
MTTVTTGQRTTGELAPPGVDVSTWHGAGFPTQVALLTGRLLRQQAQHPLSALLGLLQPMVILFLFTQVFAKVVAGTGQLTGGISYLDFLMPAIVVIGAFTTAVNSGAGMVEEVKNGVMARLRSLPITSASVVIARSLADAVRNAVQLGVMLVVAVLVFGFRPAGGVLGTLGCWLVAVLIGWSLSWVFMALATWIRDAELTQVAGATIMLPLMFASSAYVPIDSMTEWMGAVARVNPLTFAVDTSRSLALGLPLESGPLWALLVSIAGVVLAIVMALRGFRRRAA